MNDVSKPRREASWYCSCKGTCSYQRVHRATVFQITNHCHSDIVELALLLDDRVDVQQRLRGVLVRAVTGVEQRDIQVLRTDQ